MHHPMLIWTAAAAGGAPRDLDDALRQRDALAGTPQRCRGEFQRVGKLLKARFAAAGGKVFDDDPSDWGSDPAKPCPALWSLQVNADHAAEVFDYLGTRAPALGLVLLDAERSQFRAPAARAPAPAPAPASKGDIERIIGDLFHEVLANQGFKRLPGGEFEHQATAGSLSLLVDVIESSPRTQFDIKVGVNVRFPVFRNLLKAIPGLDGCYPPNAPTITSELAIVASVSRSTRDLFKDRPPGRVALAIRDPKQAVRQVRDELVPMLAAVTDDPWWMDFREFIRVYLDLYLKCEQVPAGFEFVCMEDLILTRLFSNAHFEPLFRKRVQAERRYAAMMPRPRRWSTVEGLTRVHDYVARNFPADELAPR